MNREWKSEINPFNSMKVLAWQDHIRGILNEDFLPPVVVNWDLVLGCNYKCPHCMWAKRGNIPHTKIPLEFIQRVPEFLHRWGVKGVCIAGELGDPSLHPNLGEALRLLHHWNLEVGYVSNGFVLDIPSVAHYSKFAGFSMDAGTPESYAKVKGVDRDNFHTVANQINALAVYARKNNLPVAIGYKFLILPNSYLTLYEGAKIARDIGVRDFQVRPADLPRTEIDKIDVERLEEQLEKVHELETDDFHVYTVRHKFDGLKKKSQKHCWATPLTSTWTATGDVVLCVDLRDVGYNTLGNYLEAGLGIIRERWGTRFHRELIKGLNENLGKCRRCTSSGHNSLIEEAFLVDNFDMRMI